MIEYSVKRNATRVSQLMRDELMPGQELAAYWIEHVLRHNGTKHLQLASKNLPFYKRHLIDVISFLVALVFLTLAFITAILYCLVRRCVNTNKGKELKKISNKSKHKRNTKTKTN